MRTKLPIHIAEDPLRAVVRGTGMALKHLDNFKAVLMT
jgi:rod shape-determining protein MreB